VPLPGIIVKADKLYFVSGERSVSTEDYKAIALLAYSYWQARGCPIGSLEEDWYRAENDLRQPWRLPPHNALKRRTITPRLRVSKVTPHKGKLECLARLRWLPVGAEFIKSQGNRRLVQPATVLLPTTRSKSLSATQVRQNLAG
jgi:hypothetical protein